MKARAVPAKCIIAVVCAVTSVSLAAPTASANTAWWRLATALRPSYLPPGGEGEIAVTAIDLGNAAVSGTKTPVTLTDRLPAGVEAVAVTGRSFERGGLTCTETLPATTVSCAWAGPAPLQPYEVLEMHITARATSVPTQPNETAVSGGEDYLCTGTPGGKYTGQFCQPSEEAEGTPGQFEAVFTGVAVPSRSMTQPLPVRSGAVPFGVEDFALEAEDDSGQAVTQAGAHPFQLTTTFAMNGTSEGRTPPALLKDQRINLPPGLIGDPSVLAQCTEEQFASFSPQGTNQCPSDTAVGVATVTIALRNTPPTTFSVPVFNLVPAQGEPLRLGFDPDDVPVTVDTSIRTGSDYGATITVNNISQLAAFLEGHITIWGVPEDASHDGERGWSCIGGGRDRTSTIPACTPLAASEPLPFLSLPTSCTGPLQTSVEVDSWSEPSKWRSFVPAELPAGMEGCDRLLLDSSFAVAPDTSATSSPSGLWTDIHVSQEALGNPAALAPATVRDTTVVLPEGFTLNPAGANGLEACAEGKVGFERIASDGTALFSPGLPQPFCPDASKIGVVKIHTPLLPRPLEGGVYVAAQTENPFGSLVAMYIVAEDPISGVLVKLPGDVSLSATGQITTTFANTPQLPFEDLELTLFGGENAPLSTPTHCGTYAVQASFTPWSTATPASAESDFQIASGRRGGPCPGVLPFTPSMDAGATSVQAGAFTSLTTTLSREDDDQVFGSVRVQEPPGVAAVLAGVKLCEEPQAALGTCGPESLIGHASASVGVGEDPYTITGAAVYLTGPYGGAPFGLSIASLAKAGPFDLGKGPCDCVVIRSKVSIDPHTAAVTVTTDESGPYAIPRILDGIPLQIRRLTLTIDRSGFAFNPTNCESSSVTGTITSAEGALAPVSAPFDVANCATLGFAPKFTALTEAKTSKADGAYLHVKVTSGPGQANIRQVKVDLPAQLPSRDSTLNKACLAAVFEANPASCPAGSVVGTAWVVTPVLKSELTGPAYLVSHGGAAFPDLEIMLQGEGITLVLDGNTDIKKGITSSAFKAVPDAPISTFDLVLPEGPHSILAGYGDLCAQPLNMPTEITGQNGAVIKQTTRIAVSGCPRDKLHKRKTAAPARRRR